MESGSREYGNAATLFVQMRAISAKFVNEERAKQACQGANRPVKVQTDS